MKNRIGSPITISQITHGDGGCEVECNVGPLIVNFTIQAEKNFEGEFKSIMTIEKIELRGPIKMRLEDISDFVSNVKSVIDF